LSDYDNLMEAKFILMDEEHNRIDYDEPSPMDLSEQLSGDRPLLKPGDNTSEAGDIVMLGSVGGTPYSDPGETESHHREERASIKGVSAPTPASINGVEVSINENNHTSEEQASINGVSDPTAASINGVRVSINETHHQSDFAPNQEIGVSATGGSASGISTSNIGVIVNDISYSGIGITVPAGDTRASHVGAPTGESSEMENPLSFYKRSS
jgi:hypothetical protein